jgi:hypothetical protein
MNMIIVSNSTLKFVHVHILPNDYTHILSQLCIKYFIIKVISLVQNVLINFLLR